MENQDTDTTDETLIEFTGIYDPFDFSCTYDPVDNKLRLYTPYRLDTEDYAKVKSAGFVWAPKQDLFVAPVWTPEREDLMIEMCGFIGDEDTSLVDRSEVRAERFEQYSDNRAKDAELAKDGVDSITSGIPLGQPILVGHHSEKRARKEAERIDRGMRKAIQMWETSEYWSRRAEGAIKSAKYKEKPEVRARRIKKIKAQKRKMEKTKQESRDNFNLWLGPYILSKERAMTISNYNHISFCFTLAEYPRDPPVSQYEGVMGLWSALDSGIITPRQARNLAIPVIEKTIANCDRWITHCDNRLLYESAILEDQGKSHLLDKPKRPKQLPLCNYPAPDGISIENVYTRGEFSLYPQIEMTRAEYKKTYREKWTATVDGSHRVRCISGGGVDSNKFRSVVFLTDSKVHTKPGAVESATTPSVVTPMPIMTLGTTEIIGTGKFSFSTPERTDLDDMKDRLKEGVKMVVAPQLFVTPTDIAELMVEAADIEKGHTVLEPSAGTGSIIQAIMNNDKAGTVIAYEINPLLAQHLTNEYPLTFIRCLDFLDEHDRWSVDRIIMNPPFVNGQDIKHIKHAVTFLKPGGCVVALCADGPRQQKELKPLADTWINLPDGSFKDAGTMVRVVMLTINAYYQ